ncbi:DUF998 domain-containing protein [Antrihabitans sp. YC2-6]|uniref:DUF998 domain-containing protein n=1 Tax=Antrihabitans sp. YC2-6 TaxID=2799498 RepID=UPI0018F49B18|nr:DUF998 domain-containing protein [Antrihabitans sp. YC2-6]MBJ8346172.1 DUF998 domain-containing protein [Antrihabitans sp. YC2-6]
MTASARRALALAIMIGGVAYSSWVLENVLHTGLDPSETFLSELDAVGQRYRDVFSTADTASGTVLAVAAVIALFGLRRRRLTTVGWSALFVFGAATIADAQLPISCVPTPMHPCPSSPSGLFPQLHHIHALTSTIAVNAIFVAMIAFTWAAFRYRILPVVRAIGLALFVVASATTVWMLIADNLPGEYALGIAQRIQVGTMSLWVVTLGFAVWKSVSDDR